MALPTEFGLYEDDRGDIWALDSGGWSLRERRLTDGTMWPVDDYPGPIAGDAMADLASEPGVQVLPLQRIGDLSSRP